jgi:hypothetical protein
VRLLIWNIQQFSDTSIFDGSGTTAAEVLDKQDKSIECLNHILDNVRVADPDVFIVLEVQSSQGALGTLATGGGPNGLILLHEKLGYLKPDWCLVPPLRANPAVFDARTHTESVGVFWRNEHVKFRGPYVWPADKNGQPSEKGPSIDPKKGMAADSYPVPWSDGLPYDAANWAAWVPGENPKPEIGGPREIRKPYITDFVDARGRTIRVFSVHLPPAHSKANDALAEIFLNLVPREDWAPGPGGVAVVAGDLNIDYANRQQHTSVGLGLMKPLGFTTLKPYPRGAQWFGTPIDAVSMLQPTKGRWRGTVWVEGATPTSYLGEQCLDYGFALWGQGASPAAKRTYRAVDVDRVAGVVRVTLESAEDPIQTFETDMVDSLFSMRFFDSVDQFRTRENYGHIRDVSDHMALLIEV